MHDLGNTVRPTHALITITYIKLTSLLLFCRSCPFLLHFDSEVCYAFLSLNHISPGLSNVVGVVVDVVIALLGVTCVPHDDDWCGGACWVECFSGADYGRCVFLVQSQAATYTFFRELTRRKTQRRNTQTAHLLVSQFWGCDFRVFVCLRMLEGVEWVRLWRIPPLEAHT